jgi:hypothetical protein
MAAENSKLLTVKDRRISCAAGYKEEGHLASSSLRH